MSSLYSTKSKAEAKEATKPVLRQFYDLIVGMRNGHYLAEGDRLIQELHADGEIVDDQEDWDSMMWKILTLTRGKFMQSGEDDAIDLAVQLSARYAKWLEVYTEEIDKETKAAFKAMEAVAAQENAAKVTEGGSATETYKWNERMEAAWEAMPTEFKRVLTEDVKEKTIQDARIEVEFEGVCFEAVTARLPA